MKLRRYHLLQAHKNILAVGAGARELYQLLVCYNLTWGAFLNVLLGIFTADDKKLVVLRSALYTELI